MDEERAAGKRSLRRTRAAVTVSEALLSERTKHSL